MPDRVSRCFFLLSLFMFLLALATNVTAVADLEGIATQSTTVVSEPEKRGMLLAGTPHGPIAIDGDANFSDTALLEGWPGDGSPENPYIIDGLDIDLGGGVVDCIKISNTRVSFTISNCSLTGASVYPGAGIHLDNVIYGELVENIVDGNSFSIFVEYSDNCTVTDNTCNSNTLFGIELHTSDYNTVVNNTCTSNNDRGITLHNSDYNTVVNNTCTSNTENGITLDFSNFNTVANNTCTSNTENGIELHTSDYNTVANNTCNNNNYGISLYYSDSNTVVNNICTSNRIGISLDNSDRNTVVNNACFSNTEFDIYLIDSDSNILANNITWFDSVVLLLIVLVGITLLGWWKVRITLRGWWKGYARCGQDEIIVPTRYRLASWFRKRRSLKHVDVDESLEPDSSDQ